MKEIWDLIWIRGNPVAEEEMNMVLLQSSEEKSKENVGGNDLWHRISQVSDMQNILGVKICWWQGQSQGQDQDQEKFTKFKQVGEMMQKAEQEILEIMCQGKEDRTEMTLEKPEEVFAKWRS